MPTIIESDLYKHLVFAAMLLVVIVAFYKGRGGDTTSRSRGWTHVPLAALALVSLGPSALAILLYLGYASHLIQPPPSGYRFSVFILDQPIAYAVINWPFAVLYLICRLAPSLRAARTAMVFSVVAMSLPNVLLFATAADMVANVFDAGQGIGVVEAMLTLPILALIGPEPLLESVKSDSALGVAIAALGAPVPLLGVIGWLTGQILCWTEARRPQDTPEPC